MKRLVKLALASGFVSCLAAHPGWAQTKEWDKRFGGTGNDWLVGAVQIPDGRYVIAGSSDSGATGDRSEASRGGRDYWMLVLNSAGTALSDYRFGGNQDDNLASLLHQGNTGLNYIRLLGHTETAINGDKTINTLGLNDFWGLGFRLEANSTLTSAGQYAYGGAYDEYASSLAALPDWYVLNGGSTESPTNWFLRDPPRGGWDYLTVITAHAGGWVMNKRYGGSGNDWLASLDVVQNAGGGVTGAIIAGTSDSPISGDKTQASRGGNDYWLVRVDTNGVKQWDRRFGGSGQDWCRVVRSTPDGGFIVGGYTDSGAGGDKTQASRGGNDYWVVKIDSAGTKQWDRRFGGSGSDELMDLILTADGGYLLAGTSTSVNEGDKTEGSRGLEDYWIVKIDSAGNKKWDRRYGGGSNDRLSKVLQTTDGGYLLAGTSASGIGGDKTQASRGGWDYWIVKIAIQPPDAFEPDDTLETAKSIANGEVQNRSLHEAGDMDWVKFTVGAGGAADVVIETSGAAGDTQVDYYNANGVFLGSNDDISPSNRFSRIEIASLAAGTYYVRVIEKGNDEPIAAYQLRVSWTQCRLPDAYEPDDSRGTARSMANGLTQRRNIHVPGNVDWAKFTIGRHGATGVRVETSGSGADTEMWLIRGSTGAQVAYNDDISAANRCSRITRSSLPAGTYFLKLQAKGNNSVIAAYNLRASWVVRYAPDRYEPDNSRGAAKTIRNGQTQRRSIHVAGNRDWAKFTIGRNGARNVTIQTAGSSGDTEIWLYDSRGRRVAYDDNSGTGRFSRIRRSRLPAGTYTIRVQEKGNNGTIAAYTLKASWTAL